jgi:hypothetical protein
LRASFVSSTGVGHLLSYTVVVYVLALLTLAHVCARDSLLKAFAVLLLTIRFATVAAFKVALLILFTLR